MISVRMVLLVIFVLAALASGIAIGLWWTSTPPLPPIVKEIQVPVEIVKTIPGPERVVEKIRFVTRDVPVEAPPPVTPSAPVQPTMPEVPGVEPPIVGRIRLDAARFDLTDTQWVWEGTASCWTKRGDEPWQRLFEAPVVTRGSYAKAESALVAKSRRFPPVSVGLGFLERAYVSVGIKFGDSRWASPDWAELQYSPEAGGRFGAAIRWEF